MDTDVVRWKTAKPHVYGIADRACRRGLRGFDARAAGVFVPRGAGWHFGQKTLLRPPTLMRRMSVPQV
jgi:hypothetical protein